MLKNNFNHTLSTLKHNPHYLARYVNFIETRNEAKGRTESHHILPKSLFPEYENVNQNLVNLTPREHYLAHMLLYKVFPHSPQMKYAFWAMCNWKSPTMNRTFKVNSRIYEKLKHQFMEMMSEKMKNKNNFNSPKIRQIIRERYGGMGNASKIIFEKQKQTMLEKYGYETIFQTPEFIKKTASINSALWKDPVHREKRSKAISLARSLRDNTGKNNPFFGKTHTEETKNKISNTKKGIPCPRYSCIKCKFELGVNNYTQHNKSCKGLKIVWVICPHCGKEGKPGSNMNRWHFDNCKKYKIQN